MNDRLRSFRILFYLAMVIPLLCAAGAAMSLYFHPGYRNTQDMLRHFTGPPGRSDTTLEALDQYGALFSLGLFLIIFAVIWFRRR